MSFNVPLPSTIQIPLEVFDFFTLSFMVNIVQQTNLYAKQVTGDIKYESRTEITVEKLKAYIASNGDGTFSMIVSEIYQDISTLSITIQSYLKTNRS